MVGCFRSLQGVCDTPLHLFAENMGKMMVDWWAAFAHFRAYAIRPYSYSVENELLWGKYNTWKVFVWSSVFQ